MVHRDSCPTFPTPRARLADPFRGLDAAKLLVKGFQVLLRPAAGPGR